MRADIVKRGPLRATVSERWHLADNLRRFGFTADWTVEPTVHAVAIETISVEEGSRRQGLCRALIEEMCGDVRFDMVVVEGVQNPILAAALERWGWDFDPKTMDFYKRRAEVPK